MAYRAYEEFFGRLVADPHHINNFSNLIEFTQRTTKGQYERFAADWFENPRDASLTSKSDEFFAVKSRMEHLGEDLIRLLDKHQCDVLLATSSTDLPLDLGRLPRISVPLGFYSKDQPVVKIPRDYLPKDRTYHGSRVRFRMKLQG
jgi:hypothetical protein